MSDGAGKREVGDGVTLRSALLGLFLLSVMAIAGYYVQIVWGSVPRLTAGVPARAQVSLLFVLAALMGIPLLRRIGLTRRELLTIYSVLLVGGPLLSSGVLFWMIPHQAAYHYQARINPLWQTSFLQHVPGWFSPTDSIALEGFFEGGMAVPWALWYTPLLAWSLFMMCLFGATFCLMSLLGRQWITNERLTFPLAQIPLQMVQERNAGTGGRTARLSVASLFWAGLALSLVINMANSLAERVPSFPSIPIGPVTLMKWQKVGPLAGLGEIQLVFWPWLIAVAYLIPKELSFSTWFFWLVRVGMTVAAIAAGATPTRPEAWYGSSFPAPYFQGGGAVLALGLWALWIARHHLAHAMKVALGRARSEAEADEPLSYRQAFLGLALCLGGMVCFCLLAGCRLSFSLALTGIIVGYYVMWARLRAEAGLGFLFFPLEIERGFINTLGAGRFRPAEIVTLVSTRWTTFAGGGDTFEVCTGNVLESFKIADSARMSPRRLATVIMVGFLLALVLGIYVLMRGFYHYGYSGTHVGSGAVWAWSWQTRNDGHRIFQHLVSPGEADINATVAIAAGAAVAIGLGMLRLRLWWWPLHPLGYVAANTWGMFYYYCPFFIGWAFKVLVTRYGGLRLYRMTIPLAIGLIVGDMLNAGVWTLVSLVTRGRV